MLLPYVAFRDKIVNSNGNKNEIPIENLIRAIEKPFICFYY